MLKGVSDLPNPIGSLSSHSLSTGIAPVKGIEDTSASGGRGSFDDEQKENICDNEPEFEKDIKMIRKEVGGILEN